MRTVLSALGLGAVIGVVYLAVGYEFLDWLMGIVAIAAASLAFIGLVVIGRPTKRAHVYFLLGAAGFIGGCILGMLVGDFVFPFSVTGAIVVPGLFWAEIRMQSDD